MGVRRVMFSLDYDLPPTWTHISKVNQEHEVVEGYFYAVALKCGLRFPLPNFIIDVLNNYGIALSQLMPNS